MQLYDMDHQIQAMEVTCHKVALTETLIILEIIDTFCSSQFIQKDLVTRKSAGFRVNCNFTPSHLSTLRDRPLIQ